MNTLCILQGLPASGKTTKAMEMVARGYKRVNRDELRHMVDNGKYDPDNEKIIIRIETYIIQMLLRGGSDVVVDDTNMKSETISWLKVIAEVTDNCKVVLLHMDTPLSVCIERDAQRENSVGAEVIMSMYNAWCRENK